MGLPTAVYMSPGNIVYCPAVPPLFPGGSFSGFDDNEDATVRAARVKKLGVSKKWTVAALRDLCTLLGLEKGGDKV